MSQFAFLQTEWPDIYDAASRAESLAYPDPRTACFYARRALELSVFWLYKSDPALRLPYQEHLSALIHEPTFRTAVGPAIFAKVRLIKDLVNLAVHSHTSSSISCSKKPAGPSTNLVIASSKSQACLTTREPVTSITSCGATTDGPWP